MANVLVTGATGFVGGHLVEALLERGDDVTCLTRKAANLAWLNGQRVEQIRGDLSDARALRAAVKNVDVVYHVAGAIRALSMADFMEANAAGTQRLATACAAQETPPTFVYVSSLVAAGPALRGEPLVESDPCLPISAYGRSKRAGELALAHLADRLPVSIVRPPIVFGDRDSTTKSLFGSIGRSGVHFALGYRHRRRYSLVHVGDLAQALIAVARGGARVDVCDANERGFRQGCYFAAFDQRPTYAEFGQLIGEAHGRRWTVKVPVPDMLTTALAGLSDIVSQLRKRPCIFGRDKAREIKAGSWICSADKIKNELNFAPLQPLDVRLRETVAELTGATRPVPRYSTVAEHAVNS
jgi:nucleoside-diphosphate-sugar epimerase